MSKKAATKSKGLYREGRQLVIREGARFPSKCAICGKDDDVELVDFYFERKKVHGLEARAVQSVFTAASDAMSGARYTGPVQAEIPLCSGHRRRRIVRAGIGLGIAILSIGFLMIQKAMGAVIVPPGELGFLDIAIYNFIAFGLIFFAFYLVCTTLFDPQNLWFKATKYHDRFVWLSGAEAGFLSELPQYKDQHRTQQVDETMGRSSSDPDHLSAEELIRRANLDDE